MKRIGSLVLSLVVLGVWNLVVLHPCFGEEWIVEIVSVETGATVQGKWVPTVLFRKGETVSFRVDVINRASVSKDAKMTVTAYDSIDQPIGYDEEEVTLPPEATQTIHLSISIPVWAATGEAVAYINALQVIEGIPFCPPYCPETSINLTIYGCISKIVIGQGYTTDIDVYVTNLYAMEPIMFDLLVYYDDHDEVCDIIGKVNDTILEVGESESFMFIWNTAGIPYGIYYIYVWVYFDYPELEDELLKNVTVTVTIPGDVNGDCTCDMLDISILIEKFLSEPGDPLWDPNCDVNCDDSIDMQDAFISILHCGQSW